MRRPVLNNGISHIARVTRVRRQRALKCVYYVVMSQPVSDWLCLYHLLLEVAVSQSHTLVSLSDSFCHRA